MNDRKPITRGDFILTMAEMSNMADGKLPNCSCPIANPCKYCNVLISVRNLLHFYEDAAKDGKDLPNHISPR